MINQVPDILARIVGQKAAELAEAQTPLAEWDRRGRQRRDDRRDFRAALLTKRPAIIAEIKKASPSKGLLAAHFDPSSIAQSYEMGGAAAISVLTDTRFFQGKLGDLESARGAVRLPVLRKDFTIADDHVAEAAAHGADAILLIAAILDLERLRRFREYAAEFGMSALVEVHDEGEMELALKSGADLIGVNNRNLRTFEVSLDTSARLAAQIPSGIVKVSESGIESRRDIQRLQDAGYDAFLIGEHLMKAPDPVRALQALTA